MPFGNERDPAEFGKIKRCAVVIEAGDQSRPAAVGDGRSVRSQVLVFVRQNRPVFGVVVDGEQIGVVGMLPTLVVDHQPRRVHHMG